MLAIEPNVGVANYLRETFQKRLYPRNFFVLNCAVSSPPLAGRVATFHYYNDAGMSSSLSRATQAARKQEDWARVTDSNMLRSAYGPGAGGMDFVAVVSLQTVLDAVPDGVNVEFLKTDTQGHDLAVVKSARPETLRRVGKLMMELYAGDSIGAVRYEGVRNSLNEATKYLEGVGFRLTNPWRGRISEEYDAVYERAK